jgi:UDP-N-acetylmuramoylalanine--D-glutamate ligase
MISYAGKKVLLTAYGINEGSESPALYHYLKDRGCTDITTLYWGGETIRARIPSDVMTIQIENPAHIDQFDMSSFDVVFRHTSIRPDVVHALNVETATRAFFRECKAPIIGVTGTKGKGTTSSLIASILRAAGKKVHLVGNIGLPALAVLDAISPDDIVVFELSSFQLWDLDISPHVAVVLLIEPDHLDVHHDMEEYVAAKAHIRRFQTLNDVCFYHPSNPLSAQIALHGDWPQDVHERNEWIAQAHRYAVQDDEAVYVKDEHFYVGNERICPVSALRLPGQHNVENACAAISAARVYTVDNRAIETGLEAFEGLDHRLKFVSEVQAVRYYDDSIATTPGSAIAAIRAFTQPKIMIVGGSSKGADFTEFAGICAQDGSVKNVLLIGQEASNIQHAFEQAGFSRYESLGSDITMDAIVKHAALNAREGEIVILSPACASFGMFKDYKDRGEQI